jgi:hypothetical protein
VLAPRPSRLQGPEHSIEQDFREAYLNSRLAAAWAAGVAWAHMDLWGVGMDEAQVAVYRAK